MPKAFSRFLKILFVVMLPFFCGQLSVANAGESASVIQSFTQDAAKAGGFTESFDKTRERHEILFFMGVALLVLIFLTAGYGISMAMLGKEVFVHHMICAGATVFLALAHAVASIVWFFPYR